MELGTGGDLPVNVESDVKDAVYSDESLPQEPGTPGTWDAGDTTPAGTPESLALSSSP